MPVRLTQTDFISRANKIHSNYYNYEYVVYQGSMIKVKINCPIHGVFLQTPNSHLNDKHGCSKCGSRHITVEKFKQLCSEKFSNKHSYENVTYHKMTDNIIVSCPFHGEFITKPTPYLYGIRHCPVCAGNQKSTTTEFITKSMIVHGTKFDYSEVVYKNAREKVIIICKNHGRFDQTPNNHLRGQGCRKCADSVRRGGYSMMYFDYYPKKKIISAVLYVVRFKTPNEQFLKIGITQQSVDSRFKYHNKDSTIEIIMEHQGLLFDLYQKEQQILLELNNIQYIPKEKLSGYTECFVDCSETINLLLLTFNKSLV